MKKPTQKELQAVIEVRSRKFKWDGEFWQSVTGYSFQNKDGDKPDYHASAVTALEWGGFYWDGIQWIEPEHLSEDYREDNRGHYIYVILIGLLFAGAGLAGVFISR